METTAKTTELLTESEAAAYLTKSKHTLRKWRSDPSGIGPSFLKIGGSIRYLQSDIDDWLKTQRVEVGASA